VPEEDKPVVVQTSNMTEVIAVYEEITQKRVIKDLNLQDVPFTLDSQGELAPTKALAFIEASLLLNGYAILPAGEDFVKFVNTGALKVSSEGPNIVTDMADLPRDEVIVTYIHPLQYIDAEDFKKTITELSPQHAYGVITALPNSRGVVITENANTIRYYIELLKHLDVEPSRTDQKSFQLLRSSAEDVAEALNDILDLEGQNRSAGRGSSANQGLANNPGILNNPNQIISQQPQRTPPTEAEGNPGATSIVGAAPAAVATPPKIIPIPRTNRLLVIARPIDIAHIGKLIEELDSAQQVRNFATYKLKYLSALDALPIINDAITRGLDDSASGGAQGGGSGLTSGGQRDNGSNASQRGQLGANNGGSGFGSGLGGSSGGFGSSGAGSLGGGGGSLSELRPGADPVSPRPESLVVGKTLLIADPVQNEIFLSGPPDHLQLMQEVLQEIDKRPKSIVISAVIGQLNLTDDKDLGIDYIFRPQEARFGNVDSIFGGSATNRVGASTSNLDIGTLTDINTLRDAASSLTVFGAIEDQVNVAISALARSSNFKILSRPTLHTLNNKPAYIETGVRIPVPTSTIGSFQGGVGNGVNNGINSGFQSNIAFQDVALSLEVAPLIVGEDEVLLDIRQVNATVAGSTNISGNSIPNINNQVLQTTVTVKDQSSVLLGGLIQETKDRERRGIPILKDIPIIKHIASSNRENNRRTELLIFIQPRIVKGNGDNPPDEADGVGNSPLGGEMHKFFHNERQNTEESKEAIKRSKLSNLIHKLLN
jgi:type II secretion system protein D